MARYWYRILFISLSIIIFIFAPLLLGLCWQQTLRLEVLHNLHHRLLYILLVGVKVNLCVLRCLIRRRIMNTGKVWDFAGTSQRIKTLWITFLGDFERNVNVNLNERDWLVALGDFGMCLASGLAISFVGRDEGCECCGRRISKQLCNLSSMNQHSASNIAPSYLSTRFQKHTSAIRLIFSFLSFSENPRSLFNPNLTLSPSSL